MIRTTLFIQKNLKTKMVHELKQILYKTCNTNYYQNGYKSLMTEHCYFLIKTNIFTMKALNTQLYTTTK